MAKSFSARFYFQRLSPIGGTSMICAILFIVPRTVAVPLARVDSTAFFLGSSACCNHTICVS